MKTKLHIYAIVAVALAFSAPKASAQTTLIQFWDFNATPPTGGGGGDSLGNATNPLKTSYTAPSIAPDSGHIIYSRPSKLFGSTNTPDGILDNGSPGAYIYEYDNNKYSYFTQSDSAGGNNFVRARNPGDSCEIQIFIPTTGYKNIQFEFALSASSSKGENYGIFSYSTNGIAGPWNKLTSAMDTFNMGKTPDTLNIINATTAGSFWYPVQVNFTSDPNVNNNANFVVKIRLAGVNSSTLTSGNARFDNFSFWGTSMTTGINEVSQAAGYSIYPNPASDFVNVVTQYTGDKVITVYNVAGQTISTTENKDIETTINTSALDAGLYFVEIKEVSTGNKYTTKLVKE